MEHQSAAAVVGSSFHGRTPPPPSPVQLVMLVLVLSSWRSAPHVEPAAGGEVVPPQGLLQLQSKKVEFQLE